MACPSLANNAHSGRRIREASEPGVPYSSGSFSSALQPYVDAGGPVTVDLSEVTFMDSSGIHAIIEAARGLGDRGCIIIHGAHDGIQKVFELTMLDSVSNIHIIPCTVLVGAA